MKKWVVLNIGNSSWMVVVHNSNHSLPARSPYNKGWIVYHKVVDFCLAHREHLNVCIEDLRFNLRFYENLNMENECVKRVYTIATLLPNQEALY